MFFLFVRNIFVREWEYPRILKKCSGNFQLQMPEVRFKNANFSLELFKSYKIE